MTKIQCTKKEFAFNERIFMAQLESLHNLKQTECPLTMIENQELSFLTPSQRNIWKDFPQLCILFCTFAFFSFFCTKIELSAYCVPDTMPG